MCDLWQITPTIAGEALSNRLSEPTVAEKRILPAKKARSGLPQNGQARSGSAVEFATATPGSAVRPKYSGVSVFIKILCSDASPRGKLCPYATVLIRSEGNHSFDSFSQFLD